LIASRQRLITRITKSHPLVTKLNLNLLTELNLTDHHLLPGVTDLTGLHLLTGAMDLTGLLKASTDLTDLLTGITDLTDLVNLLTATAALSMISIERSRRLY